MATKQEKLAMAEMKAKHPCKLPTTAGKIEGYLAGSQFAKTQYC